MNDRALGRLLRRLYASETPPPDAALEQNLLERFVAQNAGSNADLASGARSADAIGPGRPPHPAPAANTGRTRPLLGRIAIAASVLLVLGVATRAPAEYAVELGRRVEITLPPRATPPSPKLLEDALGQGTRRQLNLRIHASSEATRIELDVFGDALPSTEELKERIVAALPGLSRGAISVMPLDGRIHDTLGGALHWEWLRLGASPGALARARAELIERIRKQAGPDAQVEVRVQDGQGTNRVEIRVEKRRPSP